MPATSNPVANPRLEISPLDSGAEKAMALCHLPGPDGGVRYAIPRNLVKLIEGFDGTRTITDAVAHFLSHSSAGHRPERLEKLVREFLIPKGLVLESTDSRPDIRAGRKSRRSFLYLRLPLLSPAVVDPLARSLRWTFSPSMLIFGGLCFLTIQVLAFALVFPHRSLDFNALDFSGVLVLMLLSTIGSLLHEMGHATAASYYGCRGVEIGWGLYLVVAVLYADVSDVWKLPRRQRALVDIGGIYFQSFFLVLVLGLFALTSNIIFLYAFLVTDMAIVASLNPFLRLDGYWLLADLFGILDLRQQSLKLIGSRARALFRGPEVAGPVDAKLDRRTLAALGVYSVLSIAFFLFLVKIMLDVFIVRILLGYPEILANAVLSLELGELNGLEIVGMGIEILWRTLMVLGFVLMFFNVANRGRKLLIRFPSRDGGPSPSVERAAA